MPAKGSSVDTTHSGVPLCPQIGSSRSSPSTEASSQRSPSSASLPTCRSCWMVLGSPREQGWTQGHGGHSLPAPSSLPFMLTLLHHPLLTSSSSHPSPFLSSAFGHIWELQPPELFPRWVNPRGAAHSADPTAKGICKQILVITPTSISRHRIQRVSIPSLPS